MKPNKEKIVCALCYGTGTELIRIGKYVYARDCKHDRQTPLLTLAEQKEPKRMVA